jgi:hypothetical protein
MSGSTRYANAVSGAIGFDVKISREDVIKSVDALRALARKLGATTLSTWMVTPWEVDQKCDDETVVFVVFTLHDDVSAEDFVKVFEEEGRKMPGYGDGGLIPGPVTVIT